MRGQWWSVYDIFITLHVPGGGHIVTALNFWSSPAPRRSILLSPPASKFGHMGTLCDPDAKKIEIQIVLELFKLWQNEQKSHLFFYLELL